MSRVVLINPFGIPPGKEAEYLAFWEQAADFMRNQPGFISMKLHRAVAPGAFFHFINVAEWETADEFQAAIQSERFRQLTQSYTEVFSHYPGLYEIIRS